MHRSTISPPVDLPSDNNERGDRPTQPSTQTERPRASRKKKKRLPLILIDPAPLTRQSIAAMFARALPEYLTLAVAGSDELLHAAEPETLSPALIVINAKGAAVTDAWVQTTLESVRSQLGEAPVVVLSDRNDVEDVINALSFGIRGYINPSVEPEVVFAALKLVRAGGTFIPAHAIRAAAAKVNNPSGCTRHHVMDAFDLTPRELSVVELLREGKPNKLIAAELRMQESTVKVHMRNIMKKLHVANRTHAASVANRLLDQQPPVSPGLVVLPPSNGDLGLLPGHREAPG